MKRSEASLHLKIFDFPHLTGSHNDLPASSFVFSKTEENINKYRLYNTQSVSTDNKTIKVKFTDFYLNRLIPETRLGPVYGTHRKVASKIPCFSL